MMDLDKFSAESSQVRLVGPPEDPRKPHVVLFVEAKDAHARRMGRLRCVCRPGLSSSGHAVTAYVWEEEMAPDALGGERWTAISPMVALVETLVRVLVSWRPA